MKYRPVGLATLFGGAIGSLLMWWLRRKRKGEAPASAGGREGHPVPQPDASGVPPERKT